MRLLDHCLILDPYQMMEGWMGVGKQAYFWAIFSHYKGTKTYQLLQQEFPSLDWIRTSFLLMACMVAQSLFLMVGKAVSSQGNCPPHCRWGNPAVPLCVGHDL